MDIKNAKYIYHLAEDNTHNSKLIIRLANAIIKAMAMSNEHTIDYLEQISWVDFIKLIEDINLQENINKEEIISNLISALVSTKEKYLISDAYEKLKNNNKLTKDIISTKDCDFISFFIDKQIITIEQFYEEATQLNDFELIINLLCHHNCKWKNVLKTMNLIEKERNAQHIFRLSQTIIEELKKRNSSIEEAIFPNTFKSFTIAIIETEELEYIKLFRDNIIKAKTNNLESFFNRALNKVNINLLNRAIEELEIKNKYSFKHGEAGPRETADKGISKTLSKPNNQK